jgi:hypothetical protein
MNGLAFITPALFTSRGDARALVGHPGDALGIGDVESDRSHTGLGNGGRIARRPVDPGRAPADQLPGEHLAEPAVGTGDRGHRSVDLHGVQSKSALPRTTRVASPRVGSVTMVRSGSDAGENQ